jgi:hypothetical protein
MTKRIAWATEQDKALFALAVRVLKEHHDLGRKWPLNYTLPTGRSIEAVCDRAVDLDGQIPDDLLRVLHDLAVALSIAEWENSMATMPWSYARSQHSWRCLSINDTLGPGDIVQVGCGCATIGFATRNAMRAAGTRLVWVITSAISAGKRMSDGGFPVISPKKSWTREQWAIYRRMPWTHRKLADMMVLVPGVSRWLAGRAVKYEVRWRKGGEGQKGATADGPERKAPENRLA